MDNQFIVFKENNITNIIPLDFCTFEGTKDSCSIRCQGLIYLVRKDINLIIENIKSSLDKFIYI